MARRHRVAERGVAMKVSPKTKGREAVHQEILRSFMARSTRALEGLAHAASDEVLAEALAAPTDVGALARVIAHIGPSQLAVEVKDPLADAIARGTAVKEELLVRAGGSFTAAEVGGLLDVTRQAVDKRRKAGTLLAVPLGNGDYAYPACQFTANGVLPGLPDVLAAFRVVNPWTRLAVLMAEEPALEGRSCIDVLRTGEIDAAIQVVEGYGEQGA